MAEMDFPPLVGEIRIFSGRFEPEGFYFCDGRALKIADYEDLYSVIGTKFGGDGSEHFSLPDLRGRTALHAGHSSGLTRRRLGDAVGAIEHALSEPELPAHRHQIKASTKNADGLEPNVGSVFGQPADGTKLYRHDRPDKPMHNAAMSKVGEGKPHPNMQPFLAVNFIIAFDGEMPDDDEE